MSVVNVSGPRDVRPGIEFYDVEDGISRIVIHARDIMSSVALDGSAAKIQWPGSADSDPVTFSRRVRRGYTIVTGYNPQRAHDIVDTSLWPSFRERYES